MNINHDILPIDLWYLIGKQTPNCYYILVQTCKSMRFNFDKEHFTKVTEYMRTRDQCKIITYSLPNGWLHRTDGPAKCMIGDTYNVQEWCIDNILHRVDGPAIINNDAKYWYYHGKLHRDKLPAFINKCRVGWYQHGKLARSGQMPVDVFTLCNHLYLLSWMNGTEIIQSTYEGEHNAYIWL